MKTAPEEVVMTVKLPAVGATASSRFLLSVAEVVVGWRFSDHHTESRRKDKRGRPRLELQPLQLDTASRSQIL